MSRPAPEFSRLLDVGRVPAAGLREKIVAEADELTRLARRLRVPRIAALEAEFAITPWRRGGVRVKGRFDAEVEQICVISLDPFVTSVGEDFERFFAGESEPGTSGVVHHVEPLDEDEPDLIRNDRIDLGEIAAEALALAIDPYPRKPGAVLAAEAAAGGDAGQATPNPFNLLEKLTRR